MDFHVSRNLPAWAELIRQAGWLTGWLAVYIRFNFLYSANAKTLNKLCTTVPEWVP